MIKFDASFVYTFCWFQKPLDSMVLTDLKFSTSFSLQKKVCPVFEGEIDGVFQEIPLFLREDRGFEVHRIDPLLAEQGRAGGVEMVGLQQG